MNSTITHYFSPQGTSGEANGLPIVFREDGYINMTKAAKQFNKKLSNFWRAPDTEEYIEVLAQLPQFEAIEIAPLQEGPLRRRLLSPQAGRLLRQLAGCPLRRVV